MEVAQHLRALRHQVARRDDPPSAHRCVLPGQKQQPPPLVRMPWLKPRGWASSGGLIIDFSKRSASTAFMDQEPGTENCIIPDRF